MCWVANRITSFFGNLAFLIIPPCGKLCKIVNNIDNVNISVYNRGMINKKGAKMTPQELKKLEEEHKKAMEGINAFNKAMKEGIDSVNDYIGGANGRN